MPNGTLTIELDLDIAGHWERADPDCGIMYGGWVAEQIEGLSFTTKAFCLVAGKRVGRTHDILKGVNMGSPDVQRLIANLWDVIDKDCAAEAIGEAAE